MLRFPVRARLPSALRLASSPSPLGFHSGCSRMMKNILMCQSAAPFSGRASSPRTFQVQDEDDLSPVMVSGRCGLPLALRLTRTPSSSDPHSGRSSLPQVARVCMSADPHAGCSCSPRTFKDQSEDDLSLV